MCVIPSQHWIVGNLPIYILVKIILIFVNIKNFYELLKKQI